MCVNMGFPGRLYRLVMQSVPCKICSEFVKSCSVAQVF